MEGKQSSPISPLLYVGTNTTIALLFSPSEWGPLDHWLNSLNGPAM